MTITLYEIQQNIVGNLKFLLFKSGISQSELSQILEVERGIVSNIKTARTFPTYDTLLRMCDYFDVTVDDFLRTDMFKEIEHQNMKELSA